MAATQSLELPLPSPDTRTAVAHVPEAGALPWTEVCVLFTSPDETLRALRVASDLARLAGGEIRLVDFRVVPMGAPIESPGGRPRVEADGFLDRVRTEGIDVRVNVYVCRNARQAIPRVFNRQSIIVIGGRQRRWPTRAARWRRTLERRGHFVMFVDPSARS